MSALPYIADTQSRKLVFFTGKGGVGKTTLVWATAAALAETGKKVAVAAWSDTDARPAGFPSGVEWVHLETMGCFREYVLQVVRFEKLYETIFENRVLRTFVLAAPGLSDTVIAGKLLELYRRGVYDTVLVDLPSSGHALSFFHSPLGVKRIFGVGFVHKETARICEMLAQPDVRVDLVAIAEELPVVEGLELKEKLEKLHPFHFGFLHLNQMLPDLAGLRRASLPSSVPQSTQDLVDEYQGRWKRQESNRELAKKAQLPIVETERITAADEVELIAGVTRSLAIAEAKA